MNKLLYLGMSFLIMGGIGIVIATVLEIYTHEPIFNILIKVTAGLFGVGGPIVGIAVARRNRTKRDDGHGKSTTG
jgi:hypothetical protein